MGAVLSFQGDRKVVIYSDNHIEPTPAFGSKLFTTHGRSLFGGHSKESRFKFGHGFFDSGHQSKLNATETETFAPQHNHPTNHHHHGLKKSLGFITGLHFGKHFGFIHRDKKNRKKSDKSDNLKDDDGVVRNGIQKSLSCYNLKSGTTTNNIEIVKNIHKNLEECHEEIGEDVNHNHVKNYAHPVNPMLRLNGVDLSTKDYFGVRKPVLLTTEQFPAVKNSPTGSQQSKPIIFLSKSSQLKPNVYSVLKQAYPAPPVVTAPVVKQQAVERKTSNVSISSSQSSGSDVIPNSHKRTVIQVCIALIILVYQTVMSH